MFLCLRKEHRVNDCTSNKLCWNKNCKRKHHARFCPKQNLTNKMYINNNSNLTKNNYQIKTQINSTNAKIIKDFKIKSDIIVSNAKINNTKKTLLVKFVFQRIIIF